MNEKDHNINCCACQFHHLFLSLFVLTWRELQALLPNLFIFPKSDLPKLVFSLSTCAAYTQTFTVLVHMIISCKYTTRLIFIYYYDYYYFAEIRGLNNTFPMMLLVCS